MTNSQAHAEQQVLESAIEAIERATDLRIRSIEVSAPDGRYEDARVRIDGEEYFAEVRALPQHANLGAIIEAVKRYTKGLLVAQYVNPRLADALREAGVEFMDAAGNAYIRTPLHHVQIKGNRRPERIQQALKPRTHLTAAGLRVVYGFLTDPELVIAPYRDIAGATGVALGTVGSVLENLEAAGFLLIQGKRRLLLRSDELLKAWVERYGEVLRPKLYLGTFQAIEMDWWQEFPIEDFDAAWSGEIAGAHYTSYLRPVTATVYVPKAQQIKLVSKAGLRKVEREVPDNGTVELLTPFWKSGRECGAYVHPIVAYADLIATADPRNIEVAGKLYDECIAEHLT